MKKSEEKILTRKIRKLIAEQFVEFCFYVDHKFVVADSDTSLIKYLKSKKTELLQRSLFDIWPELNTENIKIRIKEAINNKKLFSFEKRIVISSVPYFFSISIMQSDESALILFKNVSKERIKLKELENSRNNLRALVASVQKSSEEEWRFLSMEIHDDLGQKLTAMQIEVGLLLKKLNSTESALNYDLIIEKIKNVNELIKATIDSKVNLLNKLRLDFLEELGLIDAIKYYIDEFQKRNDIKIYFYSDWNSLEIDYNKSLTFYRILQEALTNIAKHSNASEVDISFEEDKGKLIMNIIDDGIGFNSNKIKNTKGLGILGMEERALLNNCSYAIKGIPGKGVKISVTTKL